MFVAKHRHLTYRLPFIYISTVSLSVYHRLSRGAIEAVRMSVLINSR